MTRKISQKRPRSNLLWYRGKLIRRDGVVLIRWTDTHHGLNFQCCQSMVFSAITDSFEDFYQEIRRAVRYGQTEAVDVHLVIVNELEGPVLSNLLAKQENFTAIIAEMERAYLEALKELQPRALPAAA